MNINGSVVGRLGGRGYIQVTDPNPDDGLGVQFVGRACGRSMAISTVCLVILSLESTPLKFRNGPRTISNFFSTAR